MAEQQVGLTPSEFYILGKGLDKRSAIAVIEANLALINTLVPYTTDDSDYPAILSNDSLEELEGKNPFYITGADVYALTALFPEAAVNRSAFIPSGWLNHNHPEYFSSDCRPGAIKWVADSSEAFSPYAIVFGYTQYNKTVDEALIALHDINLPIPDELKRAIQIYAFIHEFAHTIILRELQSNDRIQLRLPSGIIVGARAYLHLVVGPALFTHTPLTNYAAAYRNPEVPTEDMLNEEFAETIAASILGFANTPNPSHTNEPFADRPDILEIVSNYLHAERIEQFNE
jgi:hypothetical protein